MANTMVAIATTTVGSGGASNITFSSIPGTYTDLCILFSGRTDATGGNWSRIRIGFNGTSNTTNWSARQLYGLGNSVGSDTFTTDNGAGGYTTTADVTASTFGNNFIYIPNYAGSNNKSISIDTITENNATSAVAVLGANLWSNTAAITSIVMTPVANNFAQYSTATLYGISATV